MKNLDDFQPQDMKVKTGKIDHIFEKEDCHALWAAYASGRPLLLRGKPGTGKSQLAKAIAEHLGWAFVSEVVRGNTELNDLHWHFDAIGRLGEAQLKSIPGSSSEETNSLAPEKFVSPGVFWWAFNWKSAETKYSSCNTRIKPIPEKPIQDWNAETGGVVLLLDEIDKGEPDLPNGLLETLGDYQFDVPHQCGEEGANKTIKANAENLLIIITTNEERELPQAFVRRCFVHTLKMDESQSNRIAWLEDRGRLHFGTNISDEAYQEAAEQLWKDREADPHKLYPPGLAEYIDLLRVIERVENDKQVGLLKKIAPYALKKEQK